MFFFLSYEMKNVRITQLETDEVCELIYLCFRSAFRPTHILQIISAELQTKNEQEKTI